MNSEVCANDGRRYTFLVENTEAAEDGSIRVTGGIHGQIKVGDSIYIIDPVQNVLETKVSSLLVSKDHLYLTPVDSASNQVVTVQLAAVPVIKALPKFTVLTSIRPQQSVDPKQPIDPKQAVENGQLVALLMEYNRFLTDVDYVKALVYCICHANFLVPAFVSGERTTNAAGNTVSTANTAIDFPVLNAAKDSDEVVLPIFTDGSTLFLWKGLFETHPNTKIMIMNFNKVITACQGMRGAVINPFGPASAVFSNDFIARIIQTQAYIDCFGKNS